MRLPNFAIVTMSFCAAICLEHAIHAAVLPPAPEAALPPATTVEGHMGPWGREQPFELRIPRSARPGDVSSWTIPTTRACRALTSPDGQLIAAEWSEATKTSHVDLWWRTSHSVLRVGDLGARVAPRLPAPFDRAATYALRVRAIHDAALDLQVVDYTSRSPYRSLEFTARVTPSGAITVELPRGP